jgi:hypothetical protein
MTGASREVLISIWEEKLQIRNEKEQLEMRLSEKEAALAEKEAALAEKDKVLERMLTEKDKRLAEKDERLAEKDERLAEKDKVLERMLTEKSERLAEKDAELKRAIRNSERERTYLTELALGAKGALTSRGVFERVLEIIHLERKSLKRGKFNASDTCQYIEDITNNGRLVLDQPDAYINYTDLVRISLTAFIANNSCPRSFSGPAIYESIFRCYEELQLSSSRPHRFLLRVV